MDNKDNKARVKALEYYYNNKDKYKAYYQNNKERLLSYQKEHNKKKRMEGNYFKENPRRKKYYLNIEYKQTTITFD